MQSWNASIPSPAHVYGAEYISGQVSPDDAGLYPQSDVGYPANRVGLLFHLTTTQYGLWRTFYYTTLNHGIDAFTAAWIATLGYDDHFARFVPPFVAKFVDNRLWEVSISADIFYHGLDL